MHGVDQAWFDLLHVINGRSEVTSAQFFLSESRSPIDEYNLFLQKLKDINGKDLACRFPARYEYLKLREVVPVFNLSQCSDLERFKSGITAKYVSIAMAAEYPKSAASAFGHVFLVLHGDPMPSMESDAVQFSASTDGQMGLFRYAADGIFGNFDGYFFREPLFKKMNEYLHKQQRYIFYNTLTISNDERARLINHLFELRDASFRYYFIKNNCGYQIDQLLNVALRNGGKKDRFYTLPVEVIVRHRDRFNKKFFDEPTVVLARNSISLLNEDERLRFDGAISSGEYIPDEKDSDSLKQSLYFYQMYKFHGERNPSRNFRSFVDTKFRMLSPDAQAVPNPIDRPPPRKVKIQHHQFKDGHQQLEVSFRPVLTDSDDLQMGAISESDQALLESRIALREKQFFLEDLKILNYRIMPYYSRYFRDLSWLVYFGFNRENPRHSFRLSGEMGLGQTFRLFENTLFNYIFGVGIEGDGLRPYYNLSNRMRFSHYFNSKTKLVFDSEFKSYVGKVYSLYGLKIIRDMGGLSGTFGYNVESVLGSSVNFGLQFGF